MNDVPRSAPGRKNTRRWCKGKVGREHEPQTVVDKGQAQQHGRFGCYWHEGGSTGYGGGPKLRYNCHHVIECAVCHKVLDRLWGADKRRQCPEYAEKPGPEGDAMVCRCGATWVHHIVQGRGWWGRRCPGEGQPQSARFHWKGDPRWT